MPAQLGTTGTGRLPHGWVRASSLRAATPGAAEGAGAALVAGPGAPGFDQFACIFRGTNCLDLTMMFQHHGDTEDLTPPI